MLRSPDSFFFFVAVSTSPDNGMQLDRAGCGCYLDSLLGVLLQCRTLTLEDGHVGLQQVFPLHAFPPGHGTHQNGCVQVLEGHFLLVSGDNLCAKTDYGKEWLRFGSLAY